MENIDVDRKPTNRILEMTGIISLGFLVFTVLVGHIGFILGFSVSGLTLPVSLVLYILLLVGIYLFKPGSISWPSFTTSVFIFLMLFVSMMLLAVVFFSHTYDTSWDGEGYHSNAIISFANGWNPIYQKGLPLQFPDASIFVKGYPKALWLIQSSIYLTAGDFDAAKVTNLVAVGIALIFFYTFLRKLKLSAALSVVLSIITILHPPFTVQFFSYSADLFSYEITLVAIAALGMFCVEGSINKNLLVFTLSELLLMGSKFSNLPLTAVLGSLFVIVFVIVKMDTQLKYISWPLIGILVLTTVIFVTVPYLTNILHYKHPFYPSNYESVNRTFRQDNVPLNLLDASNVQLLFYSIFSRSQTKPMGKADPQNVAVLKIPFIFSIDEITQSASMYNNRVGAAGPLFSGIFFWSATLFLIMLMNRHEIGNNADISFISFAVLLGVCFGLALVNPVPNLLRYNPQVVLIPPAIFIFALVFFKNTKAVRIAAYMGIVLITVNVMLFTGGIIWKNMKEQTEIDRQLSDLKNSSYTNIVWASNFYSNYLRLNEAGVPFIIDKNLGCKDTRFLLYSSYTTRICRVKNIK